ncbi:hypothetical protein [Paludibacterium denitrificans]|uniref:hypothetical protein n=1 Tax=Paludibacterium denitrificans TaxID=2675226 RepID=UPI001E3CE8CD|nr:hypothetical protein [Paludibacterium denitrificans]
MSLLQRFSGRESDIGFPVRRLLPNHAVRHVGPFIFLDHMGLKHTLLPTARRAMSSHTRILVWPP